MIIKNDYVGPYIGMPLCLKHFFFLTSISESPFASVVSIDILYPCFVGRIMTPRDLHTLIPGDCENVTFHGKRDLKDIIKDKDPELGRLYWIIQVDPI